LFHHQKRSKSFRNFLISNYTFNHANLPSGSTASHGRFLFWNAGQLPIRRHASVSKIIETCLPGLPYASILEGFLFIQSLPELRAKDQYPIHPGSGSFYGIDGIFLLFSCAKVGILADSIPTDLFCVGSG
jgi:hypothetical protein